MTRRPLMLALCLVLLLVGTSCSRVRDVVTGAGAEPTETDLAEAPSPTLPATPRPFATPEIEDLTLDDRKVDRKARNTDDDDGAGVAAAPMGPSGAQQPPPELEPQGSGGSRYAREAASVTEARPDGQTDGDPPTYPEARAVDIRGMGKNFRVTITFLDNVPQRMPDDQTYMVLGFGMSGRNESDDDYGFGARATSEGWLAYAGSRGSASQFPGTFFVRGNTVEMNIPWSSVGGPRPFQWYASSSWFGSTADGASYLFDPIPNNRARYPN